MKTNKKFDFGADVDFYEAEPEGFDIYSWSPEPPGSTGPATQVHMHIPMTFGRIYTRFKGPGTLDRLIDALIEHREQVWGKRRRP